MFLKRIRFSAITLTLIFFSCSGEAPRLIESWHQLNIINDPESESESNQALSFFIHGEDDDGETDLEQIYLINDEFQLFWRIPSDQWISHTIQGVLWIGFNNLLAPGKGIFPDGEYRILLIDSGGERDEKSFYLRNSLPEFNEISLPGISYDRNKITIDSDQQQFQIWFYNDDGSFVDKSPSFTMGEYEWNSILQNITRRATSFKVYTEPESGSWGMISGPYHFTD